MTKRAMKARDGYVLDDENVLSTLVDNHISSKRLSTMLNRHAQKGKGSTYLPILTKLRIEQERSDQV